MTRLFRGARLRSRLSQCAAFPVLGALALAASCITARADVFVSDTYGNAIYEFTAAGTQSTFSSNVNHPIGLAFDSAGNLYESDSNSGTIFEYTPAGVQSVFATGFYDLLGLAFDKSGDLFIAGVDSSSVGSIYEITPAGVLSTFATGLNRVRGLAFDTAGNLYVADLDSGNVYKYTTAGVQTVFASGFNFPTGLAFDASGNLFVCSQGTGVFEISPSGAVSTFTTNVTDPRWLAFDPAGNLYVTDVGDASGNPGQGTVYLFSPSGTRSTFASNLAYPTGVALTPTQTTATLPVITIAATDPAADSGISEDGVFTVSASPAPTADIKVAYSVKGTATPGVDYAALKGTVKIKAGVTGKGIKVVPEGDLGGAAKKTVKVTLEPGSAYTLGDSTVAKVKITHSNIIILP